MLRIIYFSIPLFTHTIIQTTVSPPFTPPSLPSASSIPQIHFSSVSLLKTAGLLTMNAGHMTKY